MSLIDKNPREYIRRLRNLKGEVVSGTTLTQSDAGSDSRYPIGNSTFSINGGVAWPTPKGVINTSKVSDFFISQTYTPIGEYDYFLQRKWDDTPIPPDEYPSTDGDINLTRWKILRNGSFFSYENNKLKCNIPEQNNRGVIRTNYYLGGNDWAYEFGIDIQEHISRFEGSEATNSSYKKLTIAIARPDFQDDSSTKIFELSNSSEVAFGFSAEWRTNEHTIRTSIAGWKSGWGFYTLWSANNTNYKHFKVRYTGGLTYGYAKINKEDEWTFLGSWDSLNNSGHIKIASGHTGTSYFLNPAYWNIDYLDVDYNSGSINWEIPLDGSWSSWRQVKDAATMQAEAQTGINNAITQHEIDTTHFSGDYNDLTNKPNASSRIAYNYIATEGQTSFACTYTSGSLSNIDIWKNGIKLIRNSEYTETVGQEGTSIDLLVPCILDDDIEIIVW